MKPKGIKGLKGRDQVGCVVSVGVKSEKGFPTETDRWHIVNPREEAGIRHLHPAFQAFNTARPDLRKVLKGNIVHAHMDDCFEHHLKAQVIKSPAHPNKKPQCVGDGVNAVRWIGPGPDDFKNIKCPHDLCEFRQKKPPLCKPWMRFLFKVRWQEGSPLPTPLAKFTSGAWNTTANFKGFFDSFYEAAKNLNIENPQMFGLPFIMSLAYQTKPSAKSKFPVVTISSEVDPIDFFLAQRKNMDAISAPFEQITAESEQENEVIYEDQKAISFGGK